MIKLFKSFKSEFREEIKKKEIDVKDKGKKEFEVKERNKKKYSKSSFCIILALKFFIIIVDIEQDNKNYQNLKNKLNFDLFYPVFFPLFPSPPGPGPPSNRKIPKLWKNSIILAVPPPLMQFFFIFSFNVSIS